MASRKKRIAVTIICLWITYGLASGVYQFINDRAAEREGEDWRIRAVQFASAATNFDSARTWFEANGFRVVMSKAREESTGEPIHQIVWGQRPLYHGNWLLRPKWLNLKFRFSEAGEFQDVRSDQSLYEFPRPTPTSDTCAVPSTRANDP
jgi:hypothetical protein